MRGEIAVLKIDSSKPLYYQLEKCIQDDISKGKYHPGEKMPTEEELGKFYDISRITVRRALQNLCDKGLLERKRGKGTFVTYNKRALEVTKGYGFKSELGKLGHVAGHVVVEKKYLNADNKTAEKLQIKEGDLIVFVKRILCDNGTPFAIDEITYSSDKFPLVMDLLSNDVSFYDILTEKSNVIFDRSVLELNVILADYSLSSLLHCTVGEPLFDVNKIAFDDKGDPIHISRSFVMSDRVTYVVDTNRNHTEITLEKNFDKIEE